MLAIMTYVLNLIDLICTLVLFYRFGINVESNPVGRYLLRNIPLLITVKVIFVGLALLSLYIWSKDSRIANIGLWICFIAYAIVFIYHLIIIGLQA